MVVGSGILQRAGVGAKCPCLPSRAKPYPFRAVEIVDEVRHDRWSACYRHFARETSRVFISNVQTQRLDL